MSPANPPPAPAPPGRWLTLPVLGFGTASLLSDLGHEAATSLLPALMIALGGAPAAALGVIEGVSDGASSVAKLAGGWWADRPRLRKPLCVAGYFVTGASLGLFGLATSRVHVAAVRAAGWMAKGVRGPARDTMLAGCVPREAMGRAFGFHRMMDTLGAVAGPLLAAALLATLPLRSVLGACAIPGVLAAAAFALMVPAAAAGAAGAKRPFVASLRALAPGTRRFLLAVFLFGTGDFARSLLVLRAVELLAPERGLAAATALGAALYAGHNAVYAAACFPVGWFADRVSPRALLALGYAAGTVAALLAATATPSIPVLAVLFAVAGLTLAFEDTLEGAIVAVEADPSIRGTAFGALAATNGVGDLVSSALVGVLWSVAGAGWAFGAAAVLCLAGCLLLAAGGRGDGRR